MKLKNAATLISLAREELNSYFRNEDVEKWDIHGFNKKTGAFVTLLAYPEKNLRGCIGFPVTSMPLWKTIREAAKSAAFEDPRFLPLTKEELDRIIIEISILTKPQPIETKKRKNPEDIFPEIEIGRDGLILEYSGHSGLLLPQVPVENNWDIEHFLEQLCLKSGVSQKTWKNPSCKIYKFQAQIFAETSPKGKVEEIKLV